MTIEEIQKYRNVVRGFLVDPLAELTLSQRGFLCVQMARTKKSYAIIEISDFHRTRINGIQRALMQRKLYLKSMRAK